MAIARRPTVYVEAGIAAVWGLLLALALWPGGAAAASGPRTQGPLFVCMTEMAGMGAGVAARAGHVAAAGAFTPLTGALPMLALMVTAMMLPPAMPAVGYVAVSSLYWRRRRAVAEFVVVFVAIWVAYNAAVLAAVGTTQLAASPIVPIAALALAALWQLTDFGLRNAGACVASCWAMMLTTAFVGLPSLLWMAALTGLITAERFSSRPRRASRWVAAVLGLAAIAAALLALL
jgi:predicted metal-binding membrane protein